METRTGFTIISGSASQKLATATADLLDVRLGQCRIDRFPDTEVNVQLTEPVREQRIFILQSSSPPVDENIMEVFAMADACRRAGATGITWVAPYFGYARSDKRSGGQNAIMARLIADFAQRAGIDQLITVDLHSSQVEGFFQIPTENLSGFSIFTSALADLADPETVIVSPDAGRLKIAARYATQLGCSVAALQKERMNGAETAVTRVLGEVRGRSCVIIDDMISTGGTINHAVEALIAAGAKNDFVVVATHAVFTPEARGNLVHPAIRQIIVTDSIPLSIADWPQLKVISLAPLLAATIRRKMSYNREIT